MIGTMVVMLKSLRRCLLAGLLSALAGRADAHGGVAFEDDRCVININFMQAHFTVFQPATSAAEEFCENLPATGTSVFVMEYLHKLLTEMAMDFRIVRDLQEAGRYASWEDIVAIDDLEAATVYYQPAAIETSGFYRASHRFAEPGDYLGVVTARHPVEDRNYHAVFYFRVGGRDLGSLPLFIALGCCLQLGYWLGIGGWTRSARNLRTKAPLHQR